MIGPRAFTLFARCWALALIADSADPRTAGPRYAALLAGALLLFAFPRVASLLIVSAAYLALALPEPFADWVVHRYVAATLHAAVLCSTLAVLAVHRRLPSEQDMLGLLKWPARLLACALLFPGLAKLNRDFLNPDISCAGVYYLWTIEWPGLGFLPTSREAKSLAIGLAVTGELLGPVLLWSRRTRPFGLALIWLLALGLSANTRSVYFEFIGLFWVCSLFWLDYSTLSGAADKLAALWGRCTARVPRPSRHGAVIAASSKALVAAAFWTLVQLRRNTLVERPFILLWLTMGLTTIVVVVVAIIVAARDRSVAMAPWPSATASGGRIYAIAFLAPLCLFVNESLVYLGWPNKPALRMASNFIAGEGVTNHFLLSRLPRLTWRSGELRIAKPYRMRSEPDLCKKPEPGRSLNATHKLMKKRLRQAAREARRARDTSP